MGKYDGPYFECNDEDVVSIWTAIVPYDRIPEDYWLVDYTDDSDSSPWNRFSTDFGFGAYDIDLVESYYLDGGAEASLHDLLGPLSYSESFIDLAISSRSRDYLTSYVYLMYNFRYDIHVTGITSSDYFTFLGCFDYDRSARPRVSLTT